MKSACLHGCFDSVHVAPLAGAWIEIAVMVMSSMAIGVAPLAGAWIEIFGFRVGGL